MKRYGLNEYVYNMCELFGNAALVGVMYSIASLFRKEIVNAIGLFPSLFITGGHDAGKTRFTQCLMYLHVDQSTVIYPPLFFSEQIDRIVMGWDKPLVHIDGRMSGSELKRLMSTWGQTANCGIMITSQEEMPVMDDRCLLSILPVNMGQKTPVSCDQDQSQCFNEIRKNLRRINPETLLLERRMFNKFFAKAVDTATEWLDLSVIPKPVDREILRLWSILPATYLTLAESMDFINYSKLLYLCRAGIAYHDAILRNSREEGGEI